MKFNQNILLGIIAVILCILLAYYWFFMNKVKEGLTAMTTVDLKTIMNAGITKLEIMHGDSGNEWLNLSEITIKDINGVVIQYSTTNSSSPTNKGYVSNLKGIYTSSTTGVSYGLAYLYDGNTETIFHSNDKKDTLTITFFEPQYIGSILIRNRLNISTALSRINKYTLRLYSNNIEILSHPLTDAALTSGIIPEGTINEYKFSNVITYNIIQPSLSAGPTGPAGPAGLVGSTGPIGSTGPAGIDGIAGPVGIAGPIGPRGTEGPTGPAGINGINGIDGINSINGSNGQGPQGISRENEYSYFGASSIQTIENFSIMESLSEPMACLSSPASYM